MRKVHLLLPESLFEYAGKALRHKISHVGTQKTGSLSFSLSILPLTMEATGTLCSNLLQGSKVLTLYKNLNNLSNQLV